MAGQKQILADYGRRKVEGEENWRRMRGNERCGGGVRGKKGEKVRGKEREREVDGNYWLHVFGSPRSR